MRNLKTLSFIVAATLLITACKKDKNKKSNTELLTAKAWIMTKFEEKEGNGAWVNILPYIDACSQDDEWIYNTDMTAEYTEGATACAGYSPDEVTDTGVWSFMDNETKLKVISDDPTVGTQITTIEQLDENTMVLSYTETDLGVTSTTKLTLRH